MNHEHIFPTHPLPEQQLHQHEDPIKRHAPTARQNAKQSAPPIVAKPCDPQAIPAVVNLFNNLMTIQKAEKTVFGHHDSFAYGKSNGGWSLGDKQKIDSDVNEALNKMDYPGMTGWDIGGIEIGLSKDINGVSFDKMLTWIATNYSYDHITTICWHSSHPFGGSYNTIKPNLNPIREILKKPKNYEDTYLKKIRDFFKNPKIKDIPIIFRPFHESNLENTFWWDSNNGRTAEEFRKLWHLTINYLRNNGVHNLLYAFSLNEANNFKNDFNNLYPGDDWVDIVGFDCYQKFVSEPNEPHYYDSTFKARISQHYSFLKFFAVPKSISKTDADNFKKLIAITEIGLESLKKENGVDDNLFWFTKVLEPSVKNFKLAYLTLWRNPNKLNNDPSPFYCVYKGHIAVPDFKNFFMKDKFIFHRAQRFMKLNQGPLDYNAMLVNRKIL